jgi:hypothetical protein
VTDPELGVSAGMNGFSGNWLDVHMFKFDKDSKIAIIQDVGGPITKGAGCHHSPITNVFAVWKRKELVIGEW